MMAASVPARSSRWAGTGTVTVVPLSCFCRTMWLPLRLTSTNPWLESKRQTAVPDQTRNLANGRGHFHLRNVDFPVQPPLDLAWFGRFKEQLQGFR